MDLIATNPVEGKKPGEKITVTKERGEWLLAEGYAVHASGEHEGTSGEQAPGFRKPVTVEAKHDPTLAANREAPGELAPGVRSFEDTFTQQGGATAAPQEANADPEPPKRRKK